MILGKTPVKWLDVNLIQITNCKFVWEIGIEENRRVIDIGDVNSEDIKRDLLVDIEVDCAEVYSLKEILLEHKPNFMLTSRICVWWILKQISTIYLIVAQNLILKCSLHSHGRLILNIISCYCSTFLGMVFPLLLMLLVMSSPWMLRNSLKTLIAYSSKRIGRCCCLYPYCWSLIYIYFCAMRNINIGC
jgi:hypothetical protein